MNKNFTTLGYRPDFDTMTIILTKKFAKSASLVGSKDYNTLCRLRKDYPDYKVVVREIAKKEGKKNTHKNLTYKAMGAYIDTTIADDEAKKKPWLSLKMSRCWVRARPVEPTCMFATGS